MSNNSSPPLPTLQEEQYILIGVMVSLVTYGVGLLLFVQCIAALKKSAVTHTGSPTKALFAYTCSMFIIGSFYITTNAGTKVLAYTTHRNFPGGPVEWVNVTYSSPTTFLSNICAIISSWGADGLLLYRCSIIYRNSRRAVRFVLFLPVILFVGEIVSGILVMIQVSHSPSTIWNSVNLGLPYFAICAACNVTITLTIATPLLLHRRRLAKTFGTDNEYSRPYTSAAAIVVESSALYAIVAVIFIGFYAHNDPISHLFLSTLCQVQVIAPFLIILRVATKRAWTSSTGKEIVTATASHPAGRRFNGMIDHHRDHDVIEFNELRSKGATSPTPSGDLACPVSKTGTDAI